MAKRDDMSGPLQHCVCNLSCTMTKLAMQAEVNKAGRHGASAKCRAVRGMLRTTGARNPHIHNALQHLLPVQVDFVLIKLDVHG